MKRFEYLRNYFRKNLVGITLGIILFILGSFAYLVVGKIPEAFSMNDRLQVLLSLPVAFLLYYGIRILVLDNKKLIGIFVFCLIVYFSFINIKLYYNALVDEMIQKSFIVNIEDNAIIKNNSIFIINDQTTHLNLHQRRKTTYEYAGYFRRAFGDETRFAMDYTKYLKHKKSIEWRKESFKIKTYNYSKAQFGEPTHIINIKKRKNKLNIFTILYLKILMITAKNDLKKNELLKDFLIISINKIN